MPTASIISRMACVPVGDIGNVYRVSAIHNLHYFSLCQDTQELHAIQFRVHSGV